MARGIDIANVKYVVSYDPPKYIKTHVHRIGRTARAGKEGVALTLLQKKEFFHFKKTLKQAGKKVPQKMMVSKKDLKPLVARYQEALTQLPGALKAKVTKPVEPEKVETSTKVQGNVQEVATREIKQSETEHSMHKDSTRKNKESDTEKGRIRTKIKQSDSKKQEKIMQKSQDSESSKKVGEGVQENLENGKLFKDRGYTKPKRKKKDKKKLGNDV